MKCAICKSENIKVVVTRTTFNGNAIRRRRKCLKCDYKFTTYETIDRSYLKVIKADKSLETFNKQKLITGIVKSFANLDVSFEKQLQIADAIERNIYEMGMKWVSSKIIGGAVLKKLKAVNEVAYVRFASVYYKFTTVDEFSNLISKLK